MRLWCNTMLIVPPNTPFKLKLIFGSHVAVVPPANSYRVAMEHTTHDNYYDLHTSPAVEVTQPVTAIYLYVDKDGTSKSFTYTKHPGYIILSFAGLGSSNTATNVKCTVLKKENDTTHVSTPIGVFYVRVQPSSYTAEALASF